MKFSAFRGSIALALVVVPAGSAPQVQKHLEPLPPPLHEANVPSKYPAAGERVRSEAAPKAKADKKDHGPQKKSVSVPVANDQDVALTKRPGRGKVARRGARTTEPCLHEPIEIERWATKEKERLVLTQCNGKPTDHALDQLSVLLRPNGATKPASLPDATATAPGTEWARGIKQADVGLLLRLQAVATQYPGKKITVVSGYRPGSVGSYHHEARAMDIRIDHVKNEDLVAFCKSLNDTGCGYYPNSSFVHMDARPAKSGHVYWIDASGPGESPDYVTSWPSLTPKRDRDDVSSLSPLFPHDESTHREAESGEAEKPALRE